MGLELKEKWSWGAIFNNSKLVAGAGVKPYARVGRSFSSSGRNTWSRLVLLRPATNMVTPSHCCRRERIRGRGRDGSAWSFRRGYLTGACVRCCGVRPTTNKGKQRQPLSCCELQRDREEIDRKGTLWGWGCESWRAAEMVRFPVTVGRRRGVLGSFSV